MTCKKFCSKFKALIEPRQMRYVHVSICYLKNDIFPSFCIPCSFDFQQDGETAILHAIRRLDQNSVEILNCYHFGPTLFGLAPCGYTPLMVAVQLGARELCKLLLKLMDYDLSQINCVSTVHEWYRMVSLYFLK